MFVFLFYCFYFLVSYMNSLSVCRSGRFWSTYIIHAHAVHVNSSPIDDQVAMLHA